MRVTFNSGFAHLVHEINGASERLLDRQREVSSGRRVHVPSDNPTATVGIVKERAEMATIDRFSRTADSADSRLRVLDSVLSNVVDQVQAALTQGAAGRSTTLSQEARQATALGILGIRDGILASVNSQYQGSYLFAGGETTTAPYTKTGTTISGYQGDATLVRLDISRSQTVGVTIDGDAVLRGTDASDVFSVLGALATAVQNGDMPGVDQGIASLNRAFARVTQAQSRVGTDLAAIESERLRLDETRRASDTRRSTLEDANLVEAISGMNAAAQAHEAALAALSRSNKLSLLDYLG